jgi:hypothetical protein
MDEIYVGAGSEKFVRGKEEDRDVCEGIDVVHDLLELFWPLPLEGKQLVRHNGGDFAANGAVTQGISQVPDQFVFPPYLRFDLSEGREPALEILVYCEHLEGTMGIAM